jgi:hypothetical protein
MPWHSGIAMPADAKMSFDYAAVDLVRCVHGRVCFRSNTSSRTVLRASEPPARVMDQERVKRVCADS